MIIFLLIKLMEYISQFVNPNNTVFFALDLKNIALDIKKCYPTTR